jgi:hypothetical protein
MGRDDGFSIADISTGYYDDEKVRRLWREVGNDVAAMCEALTLHQATVLASWREGKRVTVDEAAPLWLPTRPEIVAALAAVGMLDRTSKVPSRSWSGWFLPAFTRREARREAGRSGGLAKAKHRSSNATTDGYPSVPTVPTVPTGRPAGPRSAAAREPKNGRAAAGPSSLGEALSGTPFGAELEGRKVSR